MTHEQFILSEIERLQPWYHTVKISDALTITGWDGLAPIWENIRKVRAALNYQEKRVLDIGSRDGMWAFEAERLGASCVVATDVCGQPYYDHAQLLRFLLRSKVFLYYNTPVEKLCDALEYFWSWNIGHFDIVQHLGVLYHLPDPMVSLVQCRKALNIGGSLILETAVFLGDDAPMARFNSDSGIYTDKYTFWAFNRAALIAALEMSGFKVDQTSWSEVHQTDSIHRACVLATAI